MKTDYKHSAPKTAADVLTLSNKWKLSLGLSFLAFAIIWKLCAWLSNHREESEVEWVNPHQIILDVSLPKNEDSSLIAQSTLKEVFKEPLIWKKFTIKAGANLGTYFHEAGLESHALQEVLSLKDAHHLKKIYPGQKLRFHQKTKGKLQALQFDIDPLTTLVITRQDNGKLTSKMQAKPIEKRVAFGGSRIFDSFFVAGKQANLDDALIMELANVFAYDIDFAQDIKPNDHFKVLYEEYFVNGVKVGNGPIVAAEFVNNGKQFRAVRYTDVQGNSGYYSPSGQSLKKAFIRTPVQFTRISSHFNLNRKHPVLHKIRAHRGVDYAAPTGTPVKATGSGKVQFVGQKGGYGNTIILQHGVKYTTLYAHLSRFAKNLKQGQSIRQGDIIGYVGKTGLASGPHLHYEFRINGLHHNPLTVALPQAESIPAHGKKQFLAHADELFSILNKHEKVLLASK